MRNAFRKISQSLAGNDKWQHRLAYAAGEILLVMVGILLALEVNNWSDRRKASQMEREIIHSLHVEFGDAKEQLLHDKDILAFQAGTLLNILNYCEPGHATISPTAMDSLIHHSYALPTFDPPNATLKDILNTGKIEILQNAELRSLLSAWSGALEESRRQEDMQGDFLYRFYTPYVEERIEFKYGTDIIGDHLPEIATFGVDSRTLLDDFRFCNLLKRAYYWNWWVDRSYDDLEERVNRIIELTDATYAPIN